MIKQLAALLVLTAVLFQSHPAHAAFGFGDVVFDPTNWTENSLQVIYTLEMIKNQLLELHALVAFPIMSIARDVMRLTALLNEIKALMGGDGDGLSGMFGVIPCTESEFVTWLASGNSTMRQMYEGAMKAQQLVDDIFEVLDCITGIVDQVLSAVGNLQALQTLGQIQTVLVHQQIRTSAMMAAFHKAMTSGQVFAMVQAEAQRCIYQSRLRSLPRANVYGLQLSR